MVTSRELFVVEVTAMDTVDKAGMEVLATADTAVGAVETAVAIAGGLDVEMTAVLEDNSRKNALDLC